MSFWYLVTDTFLSVKDTGHVFQGEKMYIAIVTPINVI